MHAPVVASLTHFPFSVSRVDDHTFGVLEGVTQERYLGGPCLPQRRLEPGQSALGGRASLNAGVALDCGEVRAAVAASEREPGDELVEGDLVQHDETGAAAKRGVDPAVRLRVVAQVVQVDVRPWPSSKRPDGDDVCTPAKGRQEKRAVACDS
jgi:hypothetical protein